MLCYATEKMKLVGMTTIANSLDANVIATTRDVILIGVSLLIVVSIYLWLHRHTLKPQLAYTVAAISFIVIVAAGIGVASLQLRSDSFGSQHRAANIEFWVCGTELQPLVQSSWLGDTLGEKNFYYTHSNKQLSRSGYVMDEQTNASLGAFFEAIGGSVQADSISLPVSDDQVGWLMPADRQDGDPQGDMTTEFLESYVRSTQPKLLELSDGMRCPDGSSGKLQVFAYDIDYANNTYTQTKIEQPDDFILDAGAAEQPYQCLIVEFSESRERTNKLCESIGVRDKLRCSEFGVDNFTSDTCYLEEVAHEGEM